MYATIRRYDHVAGSVDDVMPDGRRLATAVSRVPGFVSFALLDSGDGVLVAVSIFDDPTGLADAERLVERWATDRQAGPLSSPVVAITGEVIVQKGM